MADTPDLVERTVNQENPYCDGSLVVVMPQCPQSINIDIVTEESQNSQAQANQTNRSHSLQQKLNDFWPNVTYQIQQLKFNRVC